MFSTFTISITIQYIFGQKKAFCIYYFILFYFNGFTGGFDIIFWLASIEYHKK